MKCAKSRYRREMFEPWQMRDMRPCPRQIREICSCARAAAGLEGAAGAGRGPAQNTLQTTQSQWLRPASIAGQSAHERARSAPRKKWGICAFPRNFRPVGANARNLAARANPRNLGAVSPPYYPPRFKRQDGLPFASHASRLPGNDPLPSLFSV